MKVALFRPVLCFADSMFVVAITCTALGVTQDFTEALDPSEWQFYGDTTHNLKEGWIQLTPDAPNQFSSIFYQKPINTVHFKAQFDVYLGNKDEGADGIVFAFVKEPGLGITGYGGQMAFLTGLDGYGIEFDTFPMASGNLFVNLCQFNRLRRAIVPFKSLRNGNLACHNRFDVKSCHEFDVVHDKDIGRILHGNC